MRGDVWQFSYAQSEKIQLARKERDRGVEVSSLMAGVTAGIVRTMGNISVTSNV
jgi:hypothetical protein